MVPDVRNANVQRFEIKPYVARVVCKQGYKLVGDEKLVCKNASWIPVKLPHCEGNGTKLSLFSNLKDHNILHFFANIIIINTVAMLNNLSKSTVYKRYLVS